MQVAPTCKLRAAQHITAVRPQVACVSRAWRARWGAGAHSPSQCPYRCCHWLWQVWSWCSKFKPPEAVVQAWAGTACLLHEFGK